MKAIIVSFPWKHQNTSTYYSNDKNEKEIKRQYSADKAIGLICCTGVQHCKPTEGAALAW